MKTKSNFSLAFLLPAIFILPILNNSLAAAQARAVPMSTGQKDDGDKLFPYPIPSDLPVPKNSERVKRSFLAQSLHYSFGCTDDSSEVISFYRDQLPKQGWKTTVTSASENKFGPDQSLSGRKEEDGRRKSCEIRISPLGNGTMTSSEGTFSNPPFRCYVIIRYTDPALVAKPIN